MKRDDTLMHDDPSEPVFVRELLQAGRRVHVNYDVERGLAQHLATIAAGAPLPSRATENIPGRRAELASRYAAVRSSMPAWLGYAAVPLAAASVAGLLWVFSSARPDGVAAPTLSRGTGPDASSAPSQTAEDRPAPAREPPPEAKPQLSAADGLTPAASQPPVVRVVVRPSVSHEASVPALASSLRASRAGSGARASIAAGAIDTPTPGAPSRSTETSGAPVSNPFTAEEVDRPPTQAAQSVSSNAASRADQAPAVSEIATSAESDTPPVDESQLEREMQMLAVAQRVLATHPDRALRLAQQGEREFPRTMFSAERRQLALLALVKLGRVEEARRTGRPFLRRYPNAPWSERLRRALATGQLE